MCQRCRILAKRNFDMIKHTKAHLPLTLTSQHTDARNPLRPLRQPVTSLSVIVKVVVMEAGRSVPQNLLLQSPWEISKQSKQAHAPEAKQSFSTSKDSNVNTNSCPFGACSIHTCNFFFVLVSKNLAFLILIEVSPEHDYWDNCQDSLATK